MTQVEASTEERQKQNPVSAGVLHRTSPKFPSITNFLRDKAELSLQCPQRDHHDHDDHHRLVKLLWIEICRDGGISYIHSLANYSTSRKQIQQLLKKCSVKEKYGTRSSNGGSITAFMEMYPNIFHITKSSTSDILGKQQQHNENCTDEGGQCHNNSLPVVRIPWQYYYYGNTDNEDNEEVRVRIRENIAQVLTNRVIYLVRQRSCKLKRRRRQQQKEQKNHQQYSSYPAAQLTWLANKAVNEIHQYVRLLEPEKRPKGYAVKAPQWWKQTLPLFCSFLQNQPHHFQVVGVVDDDKSQLQNQCVAITTIDAATLKNQQQLKEAKAFSGNNKDGKYECMDNVTVDLVHHDDDVMDPCESTLESATPAITAMNSNNNNGLLLYKQSIVKPIATHIKAILAGVTETRHEDDTSSSLSTHLVGGMDFGRLQENHKLRLLLSGRDLYQLIQDHPTEFDGITLIESTSEEMNDAVTNINGSTTRRRNNNYRIHYHDKCLDTKEANHDTTPQPNNNKNYAHTSMKKRGRLLVQDDVSLYSITASQQAIAMTNGLARALIDLIVSPSSLLSSFQQTDRDDSLLLAESICIDFTAGVGGNTVSFYRRFPHVIAVEIDPERAQLCHQNVMKKHGRDSCRFTRNYRKHNNPIPKDANKKGGNLDCHDRTDDRTTTRKTSGGVQVICASALNILPQLAKQFRPPPPKTICDDDQQQQQQHNGTGMDNCDDALTTSHKHKNVPTESSIKPKVHRGDGVKYHRPPIAAFLDPPWGGLDYRRNNTNNDDHNDDNFDKSLGLDQLHLSQVVTLISRHLKPFVLGMKLPLSFDIHSWMTHQLAVAVAEMDDKNNSKNDNATFRILSIKKMKRQLFLLLEIQ